MDKDTEKKERLRQMSEDLRRKAIETQEALEFAQNANDISEASIERQRKQIEATNEKLRLQLQILADTKAKLEAKLKASKRSSSTGEEPRSFAKPVTAEDAEGEVPSAEARAEGFNFKTQEQILESGTLKEKIRLYICYLDADNYFGSDSSLSEADIRKIVSSVKTTEDKAEVSNYYREYHTLNRFGENLRYYFKRFQTSFAFLAKQLYMLDKYEEAVTLLNSLLSTALSIPTLEQTGTPPKGKPYFTTEEEKSEACSKLVKRLIKSELWDGVLVTYSQKDNLFRLLHPKGGLLSRIQKEAKEVEENLADFKAYAVVAEDYCKKSKLKYLPISVQMCIENAEEERYIRYLVENLRYFRSELNYRKSKGEKISMSEYRLAVIPDYYEIKPSKDVLANCKVGINNIENELRR